MEAIGDDAHPVAHRQPVVAVQPRALIPPALHRLGIDADGQRVHLLAEPGIGGDVDQDRGIAAEAVRDEDTVEPDRRVGRRRAQLHLQIAAAPFARQLQRAAIPADPAPPISLRDIGLGIDHLLHRPVVRQLDATPVAVVIADRRRPLRDPGLGVLIAFLMAQDRRHGDVALVEQPSAIEPEQAWVGDEGRFGHRVERRGRIAAVEHHGTVGRQNGRAQRRCGQPAGEQGAAGHGHRAVSGEESEGSGA